MTRTNSADGAGAIAPVLFLVFNRPEPTARVFAAIRAARPARLYVAADGPRKHRPGEDAAVQEVRALATRVDWPCELRTLFRQDNLGCKRAVSTAVSWFFEQEPEGIVLEDDCVPGGDFFTFCTALLERYRSDERIGWISGTALCDLAAQGMLGAGEDYAYTRHPYVWGWASWRRVWQDYDVEIAAWKDRRAEILSALQTPRYRAVTAELLDRVAAGKIDTWDFQVNFMLWANARLAVAPRFNLVENVGFTEDATHTRISGAMALLARRGQGRMPMPPAPPATIVPNMRYQDYQERLASRSFLQKLLERVAIVLGYYRNR